MVVRVRGARKPLLCNAGEDAVAGLFHRGIGNPTRKNLRIARFAGVDSTWTNAASMP